MRLYIAFFAFILSFASCSNERDAKVSAIAFPPPVVKADMEMDVAVSEKETVLNAPPADRSAGQKIIKQGEIRFEAADVTKTRAGIIRNVKLLNGYIESDSENTDGGQGEKEYILTVKVPAANFDTLLGGVSSGAARIDSRHVTIQDVTSTYIDVKTRLANKAELEKRYLQLLNKGSRIADLLQIEEKLTEIRSDIESTQAQFNHLNNQVAFSSLEITFYTRQAAQVASGTGFGYRMGDALKQGIYYLQAGFLLLLSVWPFVLAWGVCWFVIRRWRRSRRETKSPTA